MMTGSTKRRFAFPLTRAVLLGCISCASCSSARYGAQETGAPSLILPAHIAEGDTGKDGGAPPADAGLATTSPAESPGTVASSLPDPEPLKTATQWSVRLAWVRGKVSLVESKRIELPHPIPTARKMGRFAVELWVGAELIDRVRFDFPLLAADVPASGPRRSLKQDPLFGPGAETQATVLLPDSDRAVRLEVVDRQNGTLLEVPWPP